MSKAERNPIGEIAGPGNRKGIFISIVGTLIVLFLLNLAAIRYVNNWTLDWGQQIVREKWDTLLDMKEPVEWLILGDSSGAVGVVPQIIDEKLKTTSINLCTHIGLGAVDDSWILETYIQRFGPPKNVLIVHVPYSWQYECAPSEIAKVPLQWNYWNQLAPQLNLDLADTSKVFYARFLPLYSKNWNLSWLLRDPRVFFRRDIRFEEDGLRILTNSSPQEVDRHSEAMISFIESARFDFATANRKALEHIIELAEEYEFDVYVANSPLYEGFYENETFRTYFSLVQEELDSFSAASSRFHYINRVPMTFPADLMDNAVHVIYPAALEYTEKLTSEIISIQQLATENSEFP